MRDVFAKKALCGDGWKDNLRISIDGGKIVSMEAGATPQGGDEHHDYLVSGIGNLHSHAFQRAMAGLAEMRGPGTDSFWSWRNVMYRFALSMSPDDVEAVAAQLYVEMLEAGFTRVGEFHYLHHDPAGNAYADIGEMAGRIAAASSQTGIGLTLLPVFYAHSGFGGGAPVDGQRRFINSIDGFASLMDSARRAIAPLTHARIGVAPHSLRAVTPEELPRVVALAEGGPVHIHVAEQVKEVEDCITWSKARPVEWLLDNANLNDRWCLIHATHMTEDETRRMAQSGAVAGLCPITEANLGDGIFNMTTFMAAGGRFGVGSDSNVLIGLPEELQMLEYSQRLQHRARNVIAEPMHSTGLKLHDMATKGAAAALGVEAGLAVGHAADFVSLKQRHFDAPVDQLLDRWIFAGGAAVDCVWVAGEKRVEGGRHVAREAIGKRFSSCMQQLAAGFSA